MSDCIDIEARGQVGELRADLTSLATDYWGKDGTNGHRSRSVLAQKRLDILERECEHYQDKVRRETCFGLAGLAEHEKDHDEILARYLPPAPRPEHTSTNFALSPSDLNNPGRCAAIRYQRTALPGLLPSNQGDTDEERYREET